MANTPNVVSGPHTYVLRGDDVVEVKLRDTIVATLRKTDTGGLVTLNTGGWKTATTKMRMNQFANEFCYGHFKVIAKGDEWSVLVQNIGTLPYEDGMQFSI